MKRLVIGVIGHVDHGKTALVRALTGTETDRLPEERRRGISIALGFAVLAVPGGEIDLVDMPGHERFVRTMVSGATGIGAALLVVAANEGVMPQTREHVAIAGLLGVKRVLVAVTKADLAEPGPAGVAAAALARDAGLEVTGMMPVAALTGGGLEALREGLSHLLAVAEPPVETGLAFLAIDRAFSVPGHGTVVTGTLRGGAMAVGDALEIRPGGVAVRVRGLQVHSAKVTRAAPGQRVAVNLRGVDADTVGRGVALAMPGMVGEGAWLSVMFDATAPLRNGAVLHVLLGTAEIEARLRLLDRDELLANDSAPAQLRCRMPVSIPARSRFIVRVPSPAITVGGGMVLDPDATRLRRHATPAIAWLRALAEGTDIAAQELVRAGAQGVALARLQRLTGLAPDRVVAGLCGAVIAGPLVVTTGALAEVEAAIRRILQAEPDGLSRDALSARLPGVSGAVLDHLLPSLRAQRSDPGTPRARVAPGLLRPSARNDGIRQTNGRIALVRPEQELDHAVADAARASALADTLRRAGLQTPDPTTLDHSTKRTLDRLVRDGVVLRLHDKVQKREVLFHRDAVEAARRVLAPLLGPPGLLVAEAGAALGVSRKYSVPLLEYLDATGFTRRVGDRRVARQPPPS